MDLAALTTEVDELLVDADAALARDYPGQRPGRQPVHTLYLPADRFHEGSVHEIGREAQRVVLENGEEGYFLEVRTAGASGKGQRAYYLKRARLAEFVDAVANATMLLELQSLLGGRFGLAGHPRNKGRFAQEVRERVPEAFLDLIRTGPVDEEGRPLEDLRLCSEREDPLAALQRVIYVPMRRVSRDPEVREVAERLVSCHEPLLEEVTADVVAER